MGEEDIPTDRNCWQWPRPKRRRPVLGIPPPRVERMSEVREDITPRDLAVFWEGGGRGRQVVWGAQKVKDGVEGARGESEALRVGCDERQ